MKIAIINDSLARGGAENQTVLTAAELQDSGRDVELLTQTYRF